MPNNIQTIIDNVKTKYPLNTFSGETLKELEVVLKDSLTSMLDGIEKDLPKPMDYVENTEFIQQNDRQIELYNQRKDSHNAYRQEVINIINSHR